MDTKWFQEKAWRKINPFFFLIFRSDDVIYRFCSFSYSSIILLVNTMKQTRRWLVCKGRSPSRDDATMASSRSDNVNILALFLSHEFDETKILVDNGVKKQTKALNSFHAFSGTLKSNVIRSRFHKAFYWVWKFLSGIRRSHQRFREVCLCVCGNKMIWSVHLLWNKLLPRRSKRKEDPGSQSPAAIKRNSGFIFCVYTMYMWCSSKIIVWCFS